MKLIVTALVGSAAILLATPAFADRDVHTGHARRGDSARTQDRYERARSPHDGRTYWRRTAAPAVRSHVHHDHGAACGRDDEHGHDRYRDRRDRNDRHDRYDRRHRSRAHHDRHDRHDRRGRYDRDDRRHRHGDADDRDGRIRSWFGWRGRIDFRTGR